MSKLRAVVVIDYQNVHLVGLNLFHKSCEPYEFLVHPLHFANQLISRRNANQREGGQEAELAKVLVYRGLPSADADAKPYARNLAQQTEWESDPRVNVTMRPLKYTYKRDADGQKATDARGRAIVTGKREKGVDVLCALALMREARLDGVDLVILASQDTDLEPALDEALDLGLAKVETASWFEPHDRRATREIRPSQHRIWNTRLNAQAYDACCDQKDYA
jgi:uncharacterized LabA/DUF88 family protein